MNTILSRLRSWGKYATDFIRIYPLLTNDPYGSDAERAANMIIAGKRWVKVAHPFMNFETILSNGSVGVKFWHCNKYYGFFRTGFVASHGSARIAPYSWNGERPKRMTIVKLVRHLERLEENGGVIIDGEVSIPSEPVTPSNHERPRFLS